MEKLVESLGITRLSKSQVSVMARDLDEQVEQFRTRPLDAGPVAAVGATLPDATWQNNTTNGSKAADILASTF